MSKQLLSITLILLLTGTIGCVQTSPVSQSPSPAPVSTLPVEQEKKIPAQDVEEVERGQVFATVTTELTPAAPEPEKKKEPAEPSFEEVASRIFDNVPKGKILAFVEFTDSQGEISKFSQAVFQEVEPIMISEGLKKDLSFIERKDLKLLMDEWDLQSIYDSGGDNGAQVLLGADYIMTGKARLSKDRVHCVFKLVDLDNGRIVGTTKAKLEAEADFYIWENVKIPQQQKQVGNVNSAATFGPNKAKSDDNKLSIWTNKKNYRIGEKIAIYFEVTEPLYVELLDVTPEGEITTIFPNPDQTDNYCLPGRVYSIPPENSSFELVVTPPSGFDRIKGLASPSPFRSNLNMKTRGISFTKNIVQNAQTRANLSFEIE